jgi:hypothetical protein
MKRRSLAWSPVAAGIAIAACSGGGSKASDDVTLAQGCSLNSDCASPLICVFSLCHQACAESRDCPPGEQCVSSGGYYVCLLSNETACATTADCPSGLACGTDHQCHDACQTASDCKVGGEVCTAGSCVDGSGASTADGGGEGGSSGGEGGGVDGGADATGDAPVSDGPAKPADAGPLGFLASNLPPSNVTPPDPDAGTAVISTQCNDCLPVTPTTITQNDGSTASLYVLDSLTIQSNASLTLTGLAPVILVVLGPVDIQGLLSVAAPTTGAGGPGGFASGPSSGPGTGTPGGEGAYASAAPGGAGYCGAGGEGSSQTTSEAPPGGTAYGNATITPLIGGSAGATWSTQYGSGGGGGALEIASSTSITVGTYGAINAGGAGGQANATSAGGSGGAILLEAPAVTVAGTLAANGGGGGPGGASALASAQPATGGVSAAAVGGDGSGGTTLNGQDATGGGGGGGGAGWIRINTGGGSATITGTLSPAQTTSCVSQGTIGG